MPITTNKHVTREETIQTEAPDAKGVYGLYDMQKNVIFYGRTDTSMRDAILNHCKGGEGKCTKLAWYFNTEESKKADAREQELLEEYRKIKRKFPKCNITLP